MSNIFSYFRFPFVQHAFIVGILIAITSAILGTILVLKRFSFIGDGLSHTGFGAMALASALGAFNKTYVVMPIVVLFSIILLRRGRGAKLKGDAYLAILSSSSLALGYIIMNKFPSSSNISSDVCSSLFGSTKFLTISLGDVLFCLAITAITLTLFVMFYNKIFTVVFDENFAKASGINTDAYNMLIAILVAITISLAMMLTGSLLISALIVFPPLSAMKIFKNFKSVILCSVAISVFSMFFGLLTSIKLETPTTATVVVFDLVIFIILSVYSYFLKNTTRA